MHRRFTTLIIFYEIMYQKLKKEKIGSYTSIDVKSTLRHDFLDSRDKDKRLSQIFFKGGEKVKV